MALNECSNTEHLIKKLMFYTRSMATGTGVQYTGMGTGVASAILFDQSRSKMAAFVWREDSER